VEIVVAMAISALLLSGLMIGYVQTLRRAEWSAYNLAAQSLAMMRLEQTRAAKWDTMASPPVDQLVSSNFPVAVEILDIPIAGTNFTFATNYTTVSSITTTPPLKLIQVQCVWRFQTGGVFTNTVTTYRAPDQ
jgi:type II secretory pathway pseudopilin PulG